MNKKKLKIGILTQPLRNNYGGLVQAYALQKFLKINGYDAWLINREYPHQQKSIIRKYGGNIYRFIQKNIFRNNNISEVIKYEPTDLEKNIISQNTSAFKDKYLKPITEPIYNQKKLNEIKKIGFEGYIVGSDQVWRPKYSPKITNYFLDFTRDEYNIRRISYAASFGVSDWEFNQQQTKSCGKLAQEFDAISVREESGVELCKKYLNVDAAHVLDPVFLLNTSNYDELISSENEKENYGTLMTYILDTSSDKEEVVNKVAQKLKLDPFTVMQQEKINQNNRNQIKKCIYPPVTRWIKGIRDSEFVITDSFHGTALAILFNKPFITIGNKKRGLTRFKSILNIFGLQNRLITSYNFSIDSIIQSNIKWNKINNIINTEREKSINFIVTNLG